MNNILHSIIELTRTQLHRVTITAIEMSYATAQDFPEAMDALESMLRQEADRIRDNRKMIIRAGKLTEEVLRS